MMNSDGAPAVERSRASDYIFEDLRQAILRGQHLRGARLPAERDLARSYGVSGPTIREAIRGLSLLGLVDVRHGSGTYVTADIDALVALSLGSVIQFEQLGVPQVLQIFGLLSGEAARLAAEYARPAQVSALRESVERLDHVHSMADAIVGIREFHALLAEASGNPLLATLCTFLAGLQIDLALAAFDVSLPDWQSVVESLQPPRRALVMAIAAGRADEASESAKAFVVLVEQLIGALPKIQQARASDPTLSGLLAATIAGQRA